MFSLNHKLQFLLKIRTCWGIWHSVEADFIPSIRRLCLRAFKFEQTRTVIKMEDTDDDAALMTEYGAIKIQSLVRMLIVRSKLLKKINARYEKIYDPKRERFYYYDKVLDQSSWGKPPLLLNSDIAEISPLFVEDDENKEQLQMTEEDRDGEEEVLGSVLDENLEKSDAEESSSDESSVDSATARERRRAKRRYPRYVVSYSIPLFCMCD